MKKICGLILIAGFIFMGWDGHVKAVSTTQDDMRVIVKYKDSANLSFSNKKDMEVKIIQQKEFNRFKRELESNPQVEYVEEDSKFFFTQQVNDPHFPLQETYFNTLNVREAWQGLDPVSKPVVAVLDSGIDHTHPDLKGTIIKPMNILAPDRLPVDYVGHGTHVSGIVGAATNNKIGISSIVRNTYIMPIKVGDSHGVYASDLAKGIDYAVKNNADILNISIAGPDHSKLVKEAIERALSEDILVVAAAGNNSSATIEYPAGYKDVLSVGAIDLSEKFAKFSNYGNWVSVAAPGEKIFSTMPTGFTNTFTGYDFMDGTSMASPFVASHAALLKSVNPNLTGIQMKHIIEKSSADKDSYSIQNGRTDVAGSLHYYHNHKRIAGATSLDTSVAIAKSGWKHVSESTLKLKEKEVKGKFAILASNQSFADSLATVPLAYKLDSPIFLSEKNYLPQSSINAMRDLGVNHVIVVGGELALGKGVESKLINSGLNTTRIAGKDRYHTAVEISKLVGTKGGDAVIVNGKSFPDALSISVQAAQMEMPIVFTEKNWIPGITRDFLSDHSFSQTFVIGGTEVISSSVLQSIHGTRIAGQNRYDTNVAIAEYFKKDITGHYIATGGDFKDALSGGLLAAKQNNGLVLVRPQNIPANTQNYLHKKRNLPYTVLGGQNAIHSNVIWEIDKILLGN